MNRIELLVRRRLVQAFIKDDPVSIELSRATESTQSAAGGWIKGEDRVLPPQQARIVLNKRRYNNGIVNVEAGDIPHTDYLLIAEHLRDIEVNDTFVWLGEHYQVTGMHKQRQESILCSIDMLGPTNKKPTP